MKEARNVLTTDERIISSKGHELTWPLGGVVPGTTAISWVHEVFRQVPPPEEFIVR